MKSLQRLTLQAFLTARGQGSYVRAIWPFLYYIKNNDYLLQTFFFY